MFVGALGCWAKGAIARVLAARVGAVAFSELGLRTMLRVVQEKKHLNQPCHHSAVHSRAYRSRHRSLSSSRLTRLLLSSDLLRVSGWSVLR